MTSGLSTRSAAVLLAGVVLAWGTNWPATKMIVQDVPPLWATAAGLQFVPAGRAIVLGYTTPLWVAIGAAMFLSEHITRRRAIGIGCGLAGLAVIFNPRTLEWGDRNALIGSGLILLAAVCWAANIVYVRAHKWISTPFQLVFWQVLLAAGILSTVAMLTDGVPRIAWTIHL